MNRIRVQHPKKEEWYDVFYSDKIYNAGHLAIFADFVNDVASMSRNPDDGYVCTRVGNECVMITKDAIYIGWECMDAVNIEVLKTFNKG